MAPSRAADGARNPVQVQEPAQEIAGAKRRFPRERGERIARKRRAEPQVVGDRALRVLRRERIGDPCRFRLMAGRAHERSRIPGKRLREAGCDLVPQEVSPEIRVGIGFVVDPVEPARPGAADDRRSRQREERPRESGAPGQKAKCRHRGETLRARAAQKLQQQRLRLVIGVVRERDHVGLRAREDGEARVAGCGLDALAAPARDRHAVHGKGNAAQRALRATEIGPCVGVRRETVVYVDRLQCHRRIVTRAKRQRVEQHHRIATAGEPDRDAQHARAGTGADGRGPPRRQRGGDRARDRVGDALRPRRILERFPARDTVRDCGTAARINRP